MLHLFSTFTLRLTDIFLLLIAFSSWGPCHLGHVPHNVGGGWQSIALRGLWIYSQALAQEQTGNSGRGDVYQLWRAGSWYICSSIGPLQELLLGTGLRAFGQSYSALPRLFFAILQPIPTSSSVLNLQKDKSGRARSQMRQMRGAEPTHLIQLPLTLVRASLKTSVLIFIQLQRKKGAWGMGDLQGLQILPGR